MLHARDQFDLVAEAFAGAGKEQLVGPDHLQRDLAAERDAEREVSGLSESAVARLGAAYARISSPSGRAWREARHPAR